MFKRPAVSETDEDLIEEERLLTSKAFTPSVHVHSANDRVDSCSKDAVSLKKSKSKFAQDRAKKKKKQLLVDHTILSEAEAECQKTSIVLGRIVERDVAMVDSALTYWTPTKSEHGYPKPPKLSEQILSGGRPPSKSLYMLHMEKEGKKEGIMPKSALECHSRSGSDGVLDALGNQGTILEAMSLCSAADFEEIHKQNINILSALTHEERLKERDSLRSSLTPAQLAFFRERRAAKERSRTECKFQFGTEATSTEMDWEALPTESHEAAQSSSERCEVDLPPLGNAEVELPLPENSEVDFPPSESAAADSLSSSSVAEGLPSLENTTADSLLSEDAVTETHKAKTVCFSESVEVKEIPNRNTHQESGIPIPVGIQNYPHMNKLEYEKLKWTSNLPPLKPVHDTEGFVARFNFQGDILPYDADVSWREGLHHHGEEPERAGYTLDELFILMRSKVIQQRHISLKTVANILKNAQEGAYDSCSETPIIQLMVDAGLLLMLRFALDESSPLVYIEALRALYYLIVSEPDELCLDLVRPWMPHGVEPEISSSTEMSEKSQQEINEEGELKDYEVIQLDVVKALIRMDLHLRLKYLLEVVHLPPTSVLHILGIIVRLVRHSLHVASIIINTPDLLSTVIKYFVPSDLSPLLTGGVVNKMSSVYGVPLWHGVKVLKIIACHRRDFATLLVNKYGIMNPILVFVSTEPADVSMPINETLILSQEAYSFWTVLMSYGLTKAQEAFTSFYPCIIRKLIFYRDNVPINRVVENRYNFDIGTMLMCLLEKALNISSTYSLVKLQMKSNEGTLVSAGQELSLPLLAWDDLTDIRPLVETCLSKWLVQLSREDHWDFSALRLIGSCCKFLCTYYGKLKDQPSFCAEALQKQAMELNNRILAPFFKSKMIEMLLSKLHYSSAIICTLPAGTERDPQNLSSLGCVMKGGEINPLIRNDSPFPLLLPLTTLLVRLHSSCLVLPSEPTLSYINSAQITRYLERIADSSVSPSHWMKRCEVYYVNSLIALASLKGCVRRSLYLKVAMALLLHVHQGDAHIVKTLLEDVICHPDFNCDLNDLEKQVDMLDLASFEPLKSPALKQPVMSHRQLTNKAYNSLIQIGHEMSYRIVPVDMFNESLIYKEMVPYSIYSMTWRHSDKQVLIHEYWPLVPLRTMINKRGDTDYLSDQSEPEKTLMVVRCLQMAYILLKHHNKTAMNFGCVTGWIRYLSLVFTCANDLFLDVDVNSYLQACLLLVVQHGQYKKLDLALEIQLLPHSMDWYKLMLQQYASVSYGDSTFALFILLPSQRKFPVIYRNLLWGDHSDVLSLISLSEKDVGKYIPLTQYTEPPENDEDMIVKYQSAIGTGLVSAMQTPFLHTVALHHLTHWQRKTKS